MRPAAPVEPKGERATIPWTKQFRRKLPSTLLSPDQLRRQDVVFRCAWRSLGESGPVIAFLNGHNERLGGQPLLLALESDEGLARVERLLGEVADSLSGKHDPFERPIWPDLKTNRRAKVGT